MSPWLMPVVAKDYHHWQDHLTHLLERCTTLADALPPVEPTGIHRDFYPDQVLIADELRQPDQPSRLYLLDLGLYCAEDPALDIGNFIAHLTELRTKACQRPIPQWWIRAIF